MGFEMPLTQNELQISNKNWQPGINVCDYVEILEMVVFTPGFLSNLGW